MSDANDTTTDTSSPMTPKPDDGNEVQRALKNFERYEYARMRGHQRYCEQARKCERFYLPGQQWDEKTKKAMNGRPAYEQNEIFPGVNSAIGYQIHNRMDITF